MKPTVLDGKHYKQRRPVIIDATPPAAPMQLKHWLALIAALGMIVSILFGNHGATAQLKNQSRESHHVLRNQ